MANPPKLQVIDGGKSDGVLIGPVQVTYGNSEMKPSYTLVVQVIEEDARHALVEQTDEQE